VDWSLDPSEAIDAIVFCNAISLDDFYAGSYPGLRARWADALGEAGLRAVDAGRSPSMSGLSYLADAVGCTGLDDVIELLRGLPSSAADRGAIPAAVALPVRRSRDRGPPGRAIWVAHRRGGPRTRTLVRDRPLPPGLPSGRGKGRVAAPHPASGVRRQTGACPPVAGTADPFLPPGGACSTMNICSEGVDATRPCPSTPFAAMAGSKGGGDSVRIVPFAPDAHLGDLQALFDVHLAVIEPTWSAPAAFIADRLRRNPGQPLLDPWRVERRTFCAEDGGGVVAAVHLLRYGGGAEVSDDYRNVAEVEWLLCRPDRTDAGTALVRHAHTVFRGWSVRECYGWGELPLPGLCGVLEAWPHIAAALQAAGFRPNPDSGEVLYGGRFVIPVPPPTPGVTYQEREGGCSAFADGRHVGLCQWNADLTCSGALPALRGWGELEEIEVSPEWRNRGIGTGLLTRGLTALRRAGCDRLAVSVDPDDEARGVGRFYRRFGLDVLARMIKGWDGPTV